MNLTETLFAAFLFAAISALTLIAYRHPQGYRKIAPVLLTIGLLYAFGRVAGDMGGMNANIRSLVERVEAPNPSIEMLKFVITSLASGFRDLKWTLGITTFATVYLSFLIFLPSILGVKPMSRIKTDTPADTADTEG